MQNRHFLPGRWVLTSIVLVLSGVIIMASGMNAAEDDSTSSLRTKATKEMNDGNFKVAYEKFRKLALNPKTEPDFVGSDLQFAVNCLNRLGRTSEFDELVESAIEVHGDNWKFLRTTSQVYRYINHYGSIVGGEFQRGNHRGQGKYANAFERDRVRALQLLDRARKLTEESVSDNDRAHLLYEYASAMQYGLGTLNSWRLQILTDLSELPDLEENYWRGYRNEGAPVDENGNPVLHRIPLTFDAARSDGERWRWLLAEFARLQPSRRIQSLSMYANFLWNQFGVQSMAQFQWMRNGLQQDDEQDESGTFALHTLSDEETIARLAVGVRRFKLPKEHNFIAIYREIAELSKTGQGERAREQLAQIYENRRQYPKAADAWRDAIRDCGPGYNDSRKKRLAQIVDHWGRFEPSQVQPSGRGAVVDFRFRNGTSVDFEAFPIDIEALFQDVKAHLKSNPQQLDGNKLNIQNIGHRIVSQNETKYVGKRVANWTVALKPRPNHVDDRITVTTPLQQSGAYLVKAKMNDGNVSQIIVWVDDTVIVRKPLDKKMLYYIADATTGKPVEKANVEFFGWRSDYQQQGRRHNVITRNLAEFSDANGQLSIDEGQHNQRFQWLVMARTDQGRLAYLGFDRVWFSNHHEAEYNQTKVFLITDRPVYRPEQEVQFKFWIRHTHYDQEDVSQFAGQKFNVICANPQGEHIFKQQLKADEYGGLSGKFELTEETKLGVYHLYLDGYGGNSFRVEEYKKPEFEVSVEAPDEPIQLGEKITATINAKYYFGAPVTNARVKYKVLRSAHDSRWSPPGEWDWFYGRGYWWFGYDYDWYPGWKRWGCLAPIQWWWPRSNDPPEVVAEVETEIGEDGTVSVEIDTALAKEIHGDQDHRYEITAEVVDESRRTIVGTGQVLVARKPFQVFGWVHRGHYRSGDDVQASFQAHTLDQKPVPGKGELTLYSVSYKDGVPSEKAVETWQLDTNDEGKANQQFKAAGPGQYRLSYKVTDAAGHSIEGGYVFVVTGENFNGREFRFNDLELITDKREYRPGDTVRLMVNTQRADSSVLLFLRPANGVYLPPKLLRLDGKSTVHEFAVVKRDMPNFFIEALTVAEAKVHTVAREVVVPPEKRVLNVEVSPSSERYKPGEEATVSVQVTDHDGEPFVGSTVLSVYDRSVEYISGGSNVPEIREFFWKWRRRHNPNTHSSLNRWSGNLIKPGQPGMSNLGVFGNNIVEEMEGLSSAIGKRRTARLSMQKNDAAKSSGYAVPAAPMSAARVMESADSVAGAERPGESGAGGTGGTGGSVVQPTVRSNFADTAFWAAAISTDENGKATVNFPMPDSLTGWKVRVWGMGHGTRVGEGSAEVVTAKDLLVRLQAPRFFVEKDEVVLSANVHNYLDKDKQVQVVLEMDGGTLAPMNDDLTQTVMVAANGEKRIDWRVRVTGEGEATVRMKALTDEESDAMEMSFPCFVHGMLKTESFSGVLRVDDKETDSQSITLRVPEERRPDQTRLELRYSPTLAGAMVDALPYLANYPYGCTEQTLNRFIPTVVTQRILQRMNLNLADIRDKRTNLNAQEIGNDVERAKRWKTFDHNPVFDEDEVERMVKQGVERLTSMQLSDGGWGWFSGRGERSWPHTTAVVVHGLQTATKNDVALVPGMLDRGVDWLKKYQAEQVQYLKNSLIKDDEQRRNKRMKYRTDNLDAFVFLILNDAGQVNEDMRDFLFRDRIHLSVYGKAVFGLALHSQDQNEMLDMILKNIEQFVVEDAENQTAYLKLPNGNWWYWWGNDLEANAWYLKLLAKTDPKSDRTAGLVKYILNNRRHGTYWRSTRDTAYCIEALADYLTASGEAKPDMTIEILVDGKPHKTVKVDSTNLFSFDNQLLLEGDALSTGEHIVEVRRRGTGPIYFNAYLTNFTQEDFITKAGLEVKVERTYYKLTRVDKEAKVAGSRGQVVDQKVEKYERTKLENLDTLKSGDIVEVELEIESKNDYEYLVFEDMKAAGFEAVEVRSGYNGNEMGAYVEYRDEKVALFVRWLPRGKHSVSYRLRAEIPGHFSALPTRAEAMYSPELKANSDEIKLNVED